MRGLYPGVSHLEDGVLILLARLVVDFGGELRHGEDGQGGAQLSVPTGSWLA